MSARRELPKGGLIKLAVSLARSVVEVRDHHPEFRLDMGIIVMYNMSTIWGGSWGSECCQWSCFVDKSSGHQEDHSANDEDQIDVRPTSQALFLDTWLGNYTLTMSRDVADIYGE